MVYQRHNAPLNRRTVCEYLLLLFPDLKKEGAEPLLTELLEKGELEPNEKRERADVGEAWVISYESWMQFENRTFHKREEVRKKQVEKIKELLQEVIKRLDILTAEVKKLQVEKTHTLATTQEEDEVLERRV